MAELCTSVAELCASVVELCVPCRSYSEIAENSVDDMQLLVFSQ